MILLLLIIFAGIIYGMYKMSGYQLTPYLLFGLIWFLILSCSLLAAPDYYFSASAVLWIVVSVIFFATGSVVGNSYLQKAHNGTVVSGMHILKYLSSFQWVSALATLVALLLIIGQYGFFDNTSKLSIGNLSIMLMNDRYSGVRFSPPIMLCFTLTYAGCINAAILLSLLQSGKKFVHPIVLFGLLYVISYITTSRSVFLYGVIIFAATLYFAAVRHTKNFTKYFSIKNISFGILLLFVVFSLFVGSQVARKGISIGEAGVLKPIITSLRVWFAGNLSGLSIWFDKVYSPQPLAWGTFTFGGLTELLGFNYRKSGVYETCFDVSGNFEYTNIYTLFRFLIDDFGFMGSLLFTLAAGFVCQVFLVKSLSGNLKTIILGSLVFSLFLYSFISSVLAYNSIVFAYIMYFFLILFFNHITTKRDGA